jgi:hypothetical protein
MSSSDILEGRMRDGRQGSHHVSDVTTQISHRFSTETEFTPCRCLASTLGGIPLYGFSILQNTPPFRQAATRIVRTFPMALLYCRFRIPRLPSGCTTVGCRIPPSLWLHHCGAESHTALWLPTTGSRIPPLPYGMQNLSFPLAAPLWDAEAPCPLAAPLWDAEAPCPLAAPLWDAEAPFPLAAPLGYSKSPVPSGCTAVACGMQNLSFPLAAPLLDTQSPVPSGCTTVQDPLFPLAAPPYRIPFSLWLHHRTESPFPSGCTRTESPFPSGCTTVQNPLFPLWLYHRTESPFPPLAAPPYRIPFSPSGCTTLQNPLASGCTTV